MIEQEFRILDTLSREMGSTMSIRQVASKIQTAYGTGDYKNIYAAIKEMEKKRMVILERAGKSSIAKLNFEDYLIVDLLAEMELKRKQEFLRGKQEMQMLMLEFDTYLQNVSLVRSISLINPERNAKINKAEFLIQLKDADKKSIEETKIGIFTIVNMLQKIHNIKLDYLVLENEAFLSFLKSKESNPIREMLRNKISILHPQDFWLTIRNEIEKGSKIITEGETNPAKITEQELVFNLARFGYTELGPKIKEGKQICIEYVITAIMFHDDARRIGAIPVILAKNPKTDYDLLLFLARKYGFEGKMLGLLKALRNAVAHGMTTIDEPIRLLEAMKIEEVKANAKRIRENLRLYNVT